ncbi:hypothetical protein SLA2020_037650 [Shorea laevis]
MASVSTVSQPMNGSDPQNSIFQFNILQRGVEAVKALVQEVIQQKLDIKQVISSKDFGIADLGYSVGPNTFIAMQNIIESVEFKYKSNFPDKDDFKFQVLFNDLPSDDFSILFQSFPPDRQFFAAGVAGRFHSQLFPIASLHFIHSCFSLHWLSSIPKELKEINKGSIYYHRGSKEVVEAYSAQFARDMESFLAASAEEVVAGGLRALLLLCLLDSCLPSECSFFAFTNLLEASLLEMFNMGLISEEQVESFNLPLYYTTPQEFGSLIKRNDFQH